MSQTEGSAVSGEEKVDFSALPKKTDEGKISNPKGRLPP
jgi:hypothetical protein